MKKFTIQMTVEVDEEQFMQIEDMKFRCFTEPVLRHFIRKRLTEFEGHCIKVPWIDTFEWKEVKGG